jgi:hypothetical protein
MLGVGAHSFYANTHVRGYMKAIFECEPCGVDDLLGSAAKIENVNVVAEKLL